MSIGSLPVFLVARRYGKTAQRATIRGGPDRGRSTAARVPISFMVLSQADKLGYAVDEVIE
jgi:hypothetical protein